MQSPEILHKNLCPYLYDDALLIFLCFNLSLERRVVSIVPLQIPCHTTGKKRDLCYSVQLSGGSCQTLWTNPASSRNLRLIQQVSQSQTLSQLNCQRFHYTSFRLSGLSQSQKRILKANQHCASLCVYVTWHPFSIYPAALLSMTIQRRKRNKRL